MNKPSHSAHSSVPLPPRYAFTHLGPVLLAGSPAASGGEAVTGGGLIP